MLLDLYPLLDEPPTPVISQGPGGIHRRQHVPRYKPVDPRARERADENALAALGLL